MSSRATRNRSSASAALERLEIKRRRQGARAQRFREVVKSAYGKASGNMRGVG
jgi:hypothetical protein